MRKLKISCYKFQHIFFQEQGIALHQLKQLSVQRSSRWQLYSYAPSICYSWAICRSYLRLQRLVCHCWIWLRRGLQNLLLNICVFQFWTWYPTLKGKFPPRSSTINCYCHIKNVNPDPEDFASYRRISKLSYTSKLLERSALVKFDEHLEKNALFLAFKVPIESFVLQKARCKKKHQRPVTSFRAKKSTFYFGLDWQPLIHWIMIYFYQILLLVFNSEVLFCFLKGYLNGRSQKVLIKEVLFLEQETMGYHKDRFKTPCFSPAICCH